jgi:hypothetical protein
VVPAGVTLAQVVPVTCTGLDWLLVPPLPSSPLPPPPQHHRVWSERVAQKNLYPASTLTQLVAPPTCPGVDFMFVVPSAS